jgi:AcrR family transcriptional regulator
MPNKQRPKGRDEVVDALVAAAQRLFAERGPASVSLREVAAEAGVNYGLVYQYIGTRDDLIRIVYRRLSEQAAAILGETADFDAAIDALRQSDTAGTYARMTAWTLLEGYKPQEFFGRSLAMEEVTLRAKQVLSRRSEPVDDDAAKLLTAVAMTLRIGAKLFGEFYSVAVGLDPSGQEVQDVVNELMHQLPEIIAAFPDQAARR